MRLKFLDRRQEKRRLARALASADGSFCCLFGRRRCGKSRLLQESLPKGRTVFYVGDHREAPLQRQELAVAMAAAVSGFDRVAYPDWGSLLGRWWDEAPAGAVLALDEFPFLVGTSPELPSVLQKAVDRKGPRARHVVICGSSQRMMQGLLLDPGAPLYGRAHQLFRLSPLPAGWIVEALGLDAGFEALEAFAVWGGVPRYWELAADHPSLWDAVRELVLDPLGVLHREPDRLLADDLHEAAQAATVLAFIGAGCHRSSELAGRLGKPATSLTRPLQRLQELELVAREAPFGTAHRAGGRSLYRIADPFLMFWFRFVEPARSLLASGRVELVAGRVRSGFDAHLAQVWEMLVREAVPRRRLLGHEWGVARRWWGAGVDRVPLEVDVVAESLDRRTLLVGEAKLRAGRGAVAGARSELARKIERLPLSHEYRQVVPVLFIADARGCRSPDIVTAAQVLKSLR